MSLYEHVHLPRLHGPPHKTEHSATSMGDRIGLAITTDARSEQTYNDAEAVLHEARQIQEHLEAQDAILERLFKEATLLRLPEK